METRLGREQLVLNTDREMVSIIVVDSKLLFCELLKDEGCYLVTCKSKMWEHEIEVFLNLYRPNFKVSVAEDIISQFLSSKAEEMWKSASDRDL